MSLTGHNHRDALKIRHNEHREKALEEIWGLRDEIKTLGNVHLTSKFDKIFTTLEGELAL